MKCTDEQLLSRLPATIQDIVETFHLNKSTVAKRLERLRQRSLTHVREYRQINRHSYAQVWAMGNGKDAPRPGNRNAFQRYGDFTRQLLDALQEYGPMTRSEICALLKADKSIASRTLGRLHRENQDDSRTVHIKCYVYDGDGERKYPRAVYAIGPGEDARKPRTSKRTHKKAYEQKLRVMAATNFVFNLGKLYRKAA